MAYQTQKHPDELIAAIVQAADNGQSPIEIRRQLEQGSFPGWSGPYEIPESTVYYHVQAARNERRARATSDALHQGLGIAVYGLAGRIYTELERQLDKLQSGGKPVPLDLLDSMAKTLKTLEALAKHRPVGTSKPTGDEENPVPSDPILKRAQELDDNA